MKICKRFWVKHILVFILIIGFKTNAFSQEEQDPVILQLNLEVLLSARFNGSSTSSMQGKPLPPPGVEGSFYLFDNWKQATIELKDGQQFDNIAVNINLYHQLLIVQYNNKESVLEARDIKTVKIDNRNFIPAIKLYDDLPSTGFYDVIVAGEITFIKHYYSILKKANYKPELNIGDRNNKFITKNDYYLYNAKTAVKIKSKKDLKKIFSAQEFYNIDKFIEANNLDIRSELGIKRVVEYYNNAR